LTILQTIFRLVPKIQLRMTATPAELVTAVETTDPMVDKVAAAVV